MTDTAKLAAALAKVQAQLPDLERDRTVEVEQKSGGKYSYSYATLAKLSKVALPLLAAHGLAFTSFPGLGNDGKMCLRYHLLHESGETLSGEFPISGEGGIQQVGGRITYARRYCLAAVVGLAADEDDEAQLQEGPRTAQRAAAPRPAARRPAPAGDQAPQTAQRRQPAAPPLPGEGGDGISPKQSQRIQILMREVGLNDREERLKYVRERINREVASSNELSGDEAERVIAALVRWRDQQEPGESLDPAGEPHMDPAEAQ